jgi:hypothetical protein
MTNKIVMEERVRRVPSQFSWVDHRLVRKHYLEHAQATSWGLYLVLVTVGNEHGLSFYSDKTLGRLLGLSIEQIAVCRAELTRIGVLAYAAPMYQVLSLEEADAP